MVDEVKQIVSVMVIFFVLATTPVWAQPDFLVEHVALAEAVINRNPKGIFTPHAYCEKDKNVQAAIPVVPASQTSQVVFWTKIEATTSGNIRHSWHHQTDGVWNRISDVNIPVKPSPGYRIWSLKSLHPEVHTGEWMIVVAPSNTPDRILCIARFKVK